jgi:AcrR family transcriptional regulator
LQHVQQMTARKEKTRRDEYAEVTRRALLDAAKELFVKYGYEATGIEAVCQAARVTRGALYHHFGDKRDLFDALVVEIQNEMSQFVVDRVEADQETDLWKRLETAMGAYLDACSSPAFRRLVLQEAPAVLGAKRFREIDQQHHRRLLANPTAALKKAGQLSIEDVDLFSHLLVGIVWEAATVMPESKDPALWRKLTLDFVRHLMETYRKK